MHTLSEQLFEAAKQPSNAGLMRELRDYIAAENVIGLAMDRDLPLPEKSAGEWLRRGASEPLNELRTAYIELASLPVGEGRTVADDNQRFASAMAEVITKAEAVVSRGHRDAGELAGSLRAFAREQVSVLRSLSPEAGMSNTLRASRSVATSARNDLEKQASEFARACVGSAMMANVAVRAGLVPAPLAGLALLPPSLGGGSVTEMIGHAEAILGAAVTKANVLVDSRRMIESTFANGGMLAGPSESLAQNLAGRAYTERQSLAVASGIAPNTAGKGLEMLEGAGILRKLTPAEASDPGVKQAISGLHLRSSVYYQDGAVKALEGRTIAYRGPWLKGTGTTPADAPSLPSGPVKGPGKQIRV